MIDITAGSEGVIISQCGKHFWNVRLTVVRGKREEVIYKWAEGLVVCEGC